MTCGQCDKRLKKPGTCKACRLADLCARCGLDPKAVLGMCFSCWARWQAVREREWNRFMSGR